MLRCPAYRDLLLLLLQVKPGGRCGKKLSSTSHMRYGLVLVVICLRLAAALCMHAQLLHRDQQVGPAISSRLQQLADQAERLRQRMAAGELTGCQQIGRGGRARPLQQTPAACGRDETFEEGDGDGRGSRILAAARVHRLSPSTTIKAARSDGNHCTKSLQHSSPTVIE